MYAKPLPANAGISKGSCSLCHEKKKNEVIQQNKRPKVSECCDTQPPRFFFHHRVNLYFIRSWFAYSLITFAIHPHLALIVLHISIQVSSKVIALPGANLEKGKKIDDDK